MARATKTKPGVIKPVKDQVMHMTVDGLSNFSAALGTNADNQLNQTTYSFNFISLNRILLEAMYRTSWVIGMGVDVVADDMTQRGVDIKSTLQPDQIEQIEETATEVKFWDSMSDNIRWSRLYGTCLGLLLIDGQDNETPLDIETISKGQFKGLLPLDRWQVVPSLGELITDLGPDMGLPKYYTMTPDALLPDLGKIHHSRVIRLDGNKLPHYQKQTNNLWGMSVIERVLDRLQAFDSTTVGAAQLVFKAYLRTWKIEGLRDMIAQSSSKMQQAFYANVEMIRRFQSNEGITLMDSKDEFETATYNFSGLDQVLIQFGQQLSGAWEIPLVRLFGQSPAGLNSTGESDLRNYYDGIAKKQNNQLLPGVTKAYRCMSFSTFGKDLPPGTRITFKPLWQLTDEQKAEIANKDSETIGSAYDRGLITQKTAMSELRQSSNITGRFSNVTDEEINAAEDTIPTAAELMAQQNPEDKEGEDGESGSK